MPTSEGSRTASPAVVTLAEIERVLPSLDLVALMEQGFEALSAGRAVVPPVGELLFEDPPGDVHLKYGYLRGDEYFVVKIASGFYDNPRLGLPSSNGLMLLFWQRTGQLAAVLLDEGHLTDVRTAAAGAVAAKHLAPHPVERIGILGTGIQARLQLEHLGGVTPCRKVLAWGRSAEALERYREEMAAKGFEVEAAASPAEVGTACDLIVTTTPATEPLLAAGELRPGAHVTAMGSDTAEKQELDSGLVAAADLVVADSRAQCRTRGEIHHALEGGSLREERVVELGEVIAGTAPGRTAREQTTIADLTGVAVQDIQIARAVFEGLQASKT